MGRSRWARLSLLRLSSLIIRVRRRGRFCLFIFISRLFGVTRVFCIIRRSVFGEVFFVSGVSGFLGCGLKFVVFFFEFYFCEVEGFGIVFIRRGEMCGFVRGLG